VLKYDYYKAQIEWFGDGKLNVSANCLDRHIAAGRGAKTAIIWQGNEPGEERHLSYAELSDLVNRFANGLRALGARKGDRVAIYMPMVPEVAVAMLACARIGLVHSVIFAGFSAESVRDRILDSQSRFVITADVAKRATKEIALKEIVDQALQGVDCVKNVVVYQRTGATVPMTPKRDLWFSELVDHASSECAAESLDAEHPLFILYTSGSTGKPKGVLHTQAGYLLYAAFTHKYVFDCHDDDIYFCAADVGWITGHSYIVYGPLANGATTVMFESTPLYPDPGRYWSVIERLRVSIFYTAPTAIRSLQKEGDEWVKKYDRSSLRILGSVGEPINEDAWRWYYSVVGEERCAVVDTWWQTETGGIMIAPLPGAIRPRPGYATRPLFGIKPVIVNESGVELSGNDVEGRLCIAFPWPGQMRTIYGDQQRFFDNYFSQYPGKYFTGDGCIRDRNGYYRITGRVDDVLNVSGHRLGTAELESAIISSGEVVEAAVVGFSHSIKGTGIYAFCVLNEGHQQGIEVSERVKATVRKVIGSFAVPDRICVVNALPKTRSGKIMRRILRKIAEGEFSDFGDTSTLAEPAVVEQIVERARGV
jgi:acetyl-CoA synthetase